MEVGSALTAPLTNSFFFGVFVGTRIFRTPKLWFTTPFLSTLGHWPLFSYLHLRGQSRRALKVPSNGNVYSLPSASGRGTRPLASSITSSYPFTSCLLSNYYVPGTVLGAGDTVEYKTSYCLPCRSVQALGTSMAWWSPFLPSLTKSMHLEFGVVDPAKLGTSGVYPARPRTVVCTFQELNTPLMSICLFSVDALLTLGAYNLRTRTIPGTMLST